MTLSVNDVMRAAGTAPSDVVRWGIPPQLDAPGIYVVSLTGDPDARDAAVGGFVGAQSAVAEWLASAPAVRVDGVPATAGTLLARLATWWWADEHVLYIGRAGTSARRRVMAYYRTPLGARRPHSGGWFLKAYEHLDRTWVHVAPAGDPSAAEDAALAAFAGGTEPPRLPFANLEWPQGRRKVHGIRGARSS